MKYKAASLPAYLLKIIRDKGTEYPYTGQYETMDGAGTYLCRQCGHALFRSESKFFSSCGWPSFDQEIEGRILREPDTDGQRMEIVCSRCKAHLGHVFVGEKFTIMNTRHCVNSASLDFVDNLHIDDTEEAILAAGCFWGVEYYFKKLKGVVKVEPGYIGGTKDNPTYQEVCEGVTGYYEAVRVLYNPSKLSYEQVLKYFFEIHDPTQKDGQGPDIGPQYLSACFYFDKQQKLVAQSLVKQLGQMGYAVATKILPISPFWPAESSHHDYYHKTKKQPYCHSYTKKF